MHDDLERPADVARWREELEDFRRAKDDYLLHDPSSPIPREHRAQLGGLPYFEPEPALRFVVPLELYRNPDVVQVQDTGGNTRSFFRWGAFHFEVDGEPCTLQAYKSPGSESLFVPFRDSTNGESTYGAGRYLDLYEDRDQVAAPESPRDGGRWTLDFNLAYNPYCAYSEHYVCPFVPPENHLTCAIPAGEKAYPLDPV